MKTISPRAIVAALVVAAAMMLVNETDLVARIIPPKALSDSTDVVGVAARFHAALAAGDSAAALALLASDVTILEAGATETLADYRAHHLSADIEFAKALPSQRTVAL